jgi:hypothetical protein
MNSNQVNSQIELARWNRNRSSSLFVLFGGLCCVAVLVVALKSWNFINPDLRNQRSEYISDHLPFGSNGQWQFLNSAHNLKSRINADGWLLSPIKTTEQSTQAWNWHYRFKGILTGHSDSGLQNRTASPKVFLDSKRIVLQHPGEIEEFYESSSQGIKQGFVINNRPSGLVGNTLILEGEVATTLTLNSERADGLSFSLNQYTVFNYSGLKVFDATGRQLPSRLSYLATGQTNSLSIYIDESQAAYPITVDPLATSPAWTLESNVTFGTFGLRVAGAGDVNGDGFSDVIISSTKYDQEYNEGKVSAFYGSSDGLPTLESWSAESNQANSSFGGGIGTAIAGGGDVNGDGYSDVIIGAPTFDNGESDEGKVFVYFGAQQGLSQSANWTAEGDQVNGYFGSSVSFAGDVNNDGFDDVLVAATGLSKVYLYFGSATGLGLVPVWVSGTFANCLQIGFSVGSAGDINNDGYGDIILGSIYCSNGQTNEGRVFAYYGSGSGLATEPDWSFESDQANAHLGYRVASAGDVNSDGYSDVLVSAIIYDNGENNEGRVFLFLGSSSGLSAVPDWFAESNQSTPSGEFGALFGSDIASGGDVDGDGFGDVLVGARGYDRNGFLKDAGRVYLFNGSASGLSSEPSWIGEPPATAPNDYCGASVDGAGDITGDGYDDIIFGCYGYDNGQLNEGVVYLHYGEPVPSPTPVVSPTPTPSPTATPTSTPSPTPTPTPEPSVDPTVSPSVTPTLSPTPTPIVLLAPKIKVRGRTVFVSVTRKSSSKDKIRFIITNVDGEKKKLATKSKLSNSQKYRFWAKFAGLRKDTYQAKWELRRDGRPTYYSLSSTFNIE